ncbi:hypothetical protein CCY99_05180 [Helicobacter sp. 16-1353]|uniref:F0F1 ATP synthase subunit B n=1 Tax=Helicobacter sp. 16-1353 TaxID=2004996 RepID=UPI000DCE6E0A|nr:F0F1 ATP synthase subunit B [Helicobacter sp. 16-1353]RAX54075.1 hypothetical protein CCY99_05180 [Helicobacter sp. 16-1353]
MHKILFILLPVFAFAADVDIANSDIIERTINFAIFVAILWYLLANRIKSALKARQDGISSQLNAVQDKLAQSKAKKEDMLKSLEQSKQKAEEIVANAKKEAFIITQNIEEQCKNDIEILNKNHQELLSFEQKRMKKAVIDDILDELLIKNDVKLDKNDYIDILLKRVA